MKHHRTPRHEERVVYKQFSDDIDTTSKRSLKGRPLKVYCDDPIETIDATIQRALKGKNRKRPERVAFGIMYLADA